MSILKDAQKDKSIISKITSGNIHRMERDKWLNFKRICLKINQLLISDGQKINLNNVCQDNNILERRKQEKILPIIIDDLVKERLATKAPDAIIVKSKEKFKGYSNAIIDFSNWVQKDGEKRLPMFYPPSGKTLHVIEKNPDGNYLIIGKLIEMPKESLYYKIFDIIYTYSDPTGYISYEDIAKKMGTDEDENRKKQILNAISNKQGFFRYAKINGKKILNDNTRGLRLIEIIKGKGIMINNPII